MLIRLGEYASDFTAETTGGTTHFHERIDDQWAIPSSRPKDFTPVCTIELGHMATLKWEFDKRSTKLIRLSVALSNHRG